MLLSSTASQPDNPDHQADRTGDDRCGRRYYYAAITWADWIAGQVLDEIDRLQLQDSTVVVVHADHGWHLGEYVSLWTMLSLLVSSSEWLLYRTCGRRGRYGS